MCQIRRKKNYSRQMVSTIIWTKPKNKRRKNTSKTSHQSKTETCSKTTWTRTKSYLSSSTLSLRTFGTSPPLFQFAKPTLFLVPASQNKGKKATEIKKSIYDSYYKLSLNGVDELHCANPRNPSNWKWASAPLLPPFFGSDTSQPNTWLYYLVINL